MLPTFGLYKKAGFEYGFHLILSHGDNGKLTPGKGLANTKIPKERLLWQKQC
jgi:hypothetical protein